MKKFVTILLALALVLAMGAVSLAAYPQTTKDWNVKVAINADGGIDVTYTIDKSDMASVAWTEMAIYDHEIDITGRDMTDNDKKDMPYDLKLARGDNNTYISERTINKGAVGADSYPFEEGKTYYIWLMACDGTNWVWNTVPTEFTYGDAKDDTGETGDFSAIAYAAAALAGCGGALAFRKKK